jgi:methionyl-tRNA formyltransferase
MARMVFLGTPDAATDPLRALVDAGHDIALVVSRPDKRRGRRGGLTPSPVKVMATELGLEVTDVLEDVLEVGAEMGVVVAFGRIVPVAVLDRVPMVNLHFSLLPRWRGAAPVERAILEGDAETGVCLMAVEAGLDTGGIYAQASTVIGTDETADQLRSRLVVMGCDLLNEHLAEGFAGLPLARDQIGAPSYAEKLLSGELELRWDRPANHINRVIRVGRAWTTFRGRRVGLVRAIEVTAPSTDGQRDEQRIGRTEPGSLVGCDVVAGGGTWLRLISVRPEGKRSMDAEDWIRGVRPEPGERLGA